MTFFSTTQHIARGSRERPRGHMIPIMLGCAVTASAIALVAYLLWPTWDADVSSTPARLPVNVGATLFNVPTAAIRMKIQRHTGPQERIDLAFASCTNFGAMAARPAIAERLGLPVVTSNQAVLAAAVARLKALAS